MESQDLNHQDLNNRDSNSQILKRALFAVRDLTTRLETLQRARTEPIAVVGMSCRYPGADSPEAFWELLRNGVDAIREVPRSRWDVGSFYDRDPEAPGKSNTRFGGYLDGAELFDAEFFGISPREAVEMDPQQRMLLEVAWEALEDAAIAPSSLENQRAGVFTGISSVDYMTSGYADIDKADSYRLTGGLLNCGPGRLAHVLGLHGPVLAVDTACSSSLTALHLACQSLRAGDCRTAIAAGVNLMASPELNVLMSKTRVLSADGRCKAFDASADGLSRAEGCGVVVLKRLSDALTDGDRIAGVIRGSAISHDGRSSAFAVPNPLAQEAVIRTALENAGVTPGEVGLIEAHGAGTALGDPIEMSALAAVFAGKKTNREKLRIGSVKTNIGHAESAAGIAGLIKILLCMRHRTIVPNLHLKTPSTHIPWESLPFEVPTRLEAWNPEQGRRIAGLSGFGVSGSIAHLVIEEPPVEETRPDAGASTSHVLAFSARNGNALKALAGRCRAFIEATPELCLEDFCYTMQTGRAHWPHRAAIVFESAQEARANLAEVERTGSADTLRSADGVLSELAKQYRSGATVDWSPAWAGRHPRKTAGPSYPFQREPYWISRTRQEPTQNGVGHPFVGHPLLGRQLESPAIGDIVFECRLSATEPEFFSEHTVYGTAVAPGTTYFEMALAAANHAWGSGAYALEDVAIGEALVFVENEPRTVQVIIHPGERESGTWKIYSRQADGKSPWTLHAEGKVRALRGDAQEPASSAPVDAARERCDREMPLEEYYQALRNRGIGHGPIFANLRRLWRGEGESLGLVTAPASLQIGQAKYFFHPALLDACFQVVGAANNDLFEKRDTALVSVGVDSLRLYSEVESELWCHAELRPPPSGADLSSDLRIFSESGRIVAAIEGILFRRAPLSAFERLAGKRSLPAAATVIDWEPRPLPSGETTVEDRWFIAADSSGLSSILAGKLEQRGGTCTLVYPGATPSELAKSVTEFLKATGPRLSRVVFVWDVGGPGEIDANCGRLLALAQAVLADGAPRLPELQIVTGAAPEQATAWGFVRCLGTERPEFRYSCLEADAGDPAERARYVLDELTRRDGENQVSVRGGVRMAARLKTAPKIAAPGARLHKNGAYLVTGGLGDLGLEVARWLAKRGAGCLALMGRSEPSQRAAQVIAELRAAGTRVQTVRCDVTDGPALAEAIESITSQLGQIRGVIHAAAVLDDGAVANQSRERFAKVFAPKIQGTLNLHRLTLGGPLDFFVLFSSAACLLGSPGQTNYAAANAFMDAFAHYRHSLGLPALSIDWGPWKEVGLAVNSAGNVRWRESGLSSMASTEALEQMEVLMGQSFPQAAILSMDWSQAIPAISQMPLFENLVREAGVSRAPAATRVPELLEKLERVPAAGKREAVFAYVREQVRTVMRIDRSRPFDEKQPLNELGLDSLMAVELKTTLGSAVGRRLSAGLLFLYPHMHALAEYLASDVLELPAAAQSLKRDTGTDKSEALLEEIELLSDDDLDDKLAELAELNLIAGERRKGISK
jgi:acyl transferase domain-containing protein